MDFEKSGANLHENDSCLVCDIPNANSTENEEIKKTKNPFSLPSSIFEWLLLPIIAVNLFFYFSPAFCIELLDNVSKNMNYFLVNSLDINNTWWIFVLGHIGASLIMMTKIPKPLKAGAALALSIWSLFWFTVVFFACNDMYARGGFSILLGGWIYLSLTIVTAIVSAVFLIISLNKKEN